MPPATQRQWILLSLLMLSAAGQHNNSLIEQLKQALRANNSASSKLAALEQLLPQLEESSLPSALRTLADKCQCWAEKEGRFLLPMCSPDYPPLLLAIADPPPLLFIQGRPETLRLPQVAMVGSRKPSPYGKKLAFNFAAQLSSAGYQITSGLAYGIDAASHEGALSSGKATIAVLGTGLNEIYPRAHRKLAEAIMEQGALVSEFSPDTRARSWHFPLRNRIISGMAHGALVVEAALSSGSLITARLAAEQGREVFAIPGPIHNQMSRGCHQLIRQGATLVESAGDILLELGALLEWEKLQLVQQKKTGAAVSEVQDLPELERGLLAQIAYNPLSVDELSSLMRVSVEALYPPLLQLELSGWIECQAGAWLRIK